MTPERARPSTTPRAIALIAVAAVAALVLAVLGLRALGVGRDRPPVVLIGDSITANAAETARDRLGDDWALTIDGRPGYHAADQLPTAQNAARFPFRQAVVNLGTNDVTTSEQDLAETIAALEQIADALAGIPCVHFVTVNESMEHGASDASVRAQRVNAAIRDLAAARPNVDVIDWAAILREEERERGTRLTTDSVHPNEDGNEILVDAYDEALDACPA